MAGVRTSKNKETGNYTTKNISQDAYVKIAREIRLFSCFFPVWGRGGNGKQRKTKKKKRPYIFIFEVWMPL